MKKTVLSLLVIGLFSTQSYAGFKGLTIHSRANCGNNESISWDWNNYWNLNTKTTHLRNNIVQHVFTTGWQNTWRSAAVCWGESYPGSGWEVRGEHYIAYSQGQMIPLGSEWVTDCSIYDGWWDKNK